MTSGQDLIIEVQELRRMLDTAVSVLGKRGRELAQAEQNYRVALAKQILLERDGGTPVTIINDVCRGLPTIASLKMERDIADVMYRSAQEAINSYKLQIRLLDNQIDRELS